MIDIKRFAPPVTRNLIFINLIIWFAQVVFRSRFGINLAEYAGLHYFEAGDFNLAQFISYMFLHSSQGFGRALSTYSSICSRCGCSVQRLNASGVVNVI